MIEFASAEAARRLAALHARAFDRPWSEPDISALLANPTAFAPIWRADGQHEAQGLALAWAPAEDAEILTLAVAPEARRRGIGAALVRAACAAALSRGARRITLEVAADNAPARALYAKLGFAEAARRANYYQPPADRPGGAYIDALVLAAPLTPP